jgi:hypothetical protein
MFFIGTMATIGGLFVLVLHNAWLYEVTSEYPNIPMTKLEAKSMDIKSRLSDVRNRRLQREVQLNYDSNNYYDRGNSL